MAQYKVPQDVEADDKLLGPFSFRQFVYLLAAGGLMALGVAFFQLFPLLVIIPLPFALFFLALALPLKKDQPMETYLAAIVSYYLKPHIRMWVPGQRESTIKVIAPKKVEESRVRDITGEEATHRLSFLVDIVDTGGYAIKGVNSSSIRDDFVAEANTVTDMFETNRFDELEDRIVKKENERHQEVLNDMREAIEKNENMGFEELRDSARVIGEKVIETGPNVSSSVVVVPGAPVEEEYEEKSNTVRKDVGDSDNEDENVNENQVNRSIIGLANNADYSVATIAKEADRIRRKDDDEVFISLH